MDAYRPFREYPDNILIDVLADRCGKPCDHSYKKLAENILQERGYSVEQIDKMVERHKRWWHVKPYFAATILRWLALLLSIPTFVVNYEFRVLSIPVYLSIVVLAALLCQWSDEKAHRGTRRYIYQGFPLPMDFYEICETQVNVCDDNRFTVIVTGPINTLIYANYIAFVFTQLVLF